MDWRSAVNSSVSLAADDSQPSDYNETDDDAAAVTGMSLNGTQGEEDEWSVHDYLLIGIDVVMVVSVIVNVLLLATVFSSRKLRRGAAAALVVALTMSNILNIVLNKVFLAVLDKYHMDPSAPYVCKAATFLDYMLNSAAIFLLVAVTYDRFMAVCRPLTLQKRRGTPLVQGIVRAATCWLFATLLALPEIFINDMIAYDFEDMAGTNGTDSMDGMESEISANSSSHYDDDYYDSYDEFLYCGRNPPDWLKWFAESLHPGLTFTVCYCVPMTLIFILYGKTAHTLMTGGSAERRGSGSTGDTQRRQREHAARSLVALALINLLIMLPMHLMLLLHDYKLVESHLLHVFAFFSMFTYVVGCMINALTVYMLSQKHRTQLVHIIMVAFRCKRRRARRYPSSPGNSSFRMERYKSGTMRSTVSTDDSTTYTSSGRY